jgi:ABC-type transporter Mla subunit MlaD
MGGTITVDIETLRGLAAQLADLADLLQADNDKGTRIGDWVSDPKIGSALSNIQHDWSNKRGEFTAYLHSVSKAAAAAANAYGTVEGDITKAARR